MAIAILIPGLILGAVAWGAVGVLRQRGREEFTLATAVAFYAQVAFIAGTLAALGGLAVLVKVAISRIDSSFAYYAPPPPPPEAIGRGAMAGISVAQQQAQDLILAAMLIVIGTTVAIGHWLLGLYLRRVAGGSPSWVRGGAAVALTVLTGLAGFVSLVAGGYTALTYFLIGAGRGGAFADPLGSAAVFVPAWAVSMVYLLRTVRRPRSDPAPPSSPGADPSALPLGSS